MDIELTKILNKVQVLSTNKEYKYNKMECINSKPALQAGNENLTEYGILLQLHCMICNPKKIIEKIENYAASRQPFDWIYNGKYMGEFVIDSIEKNIEKQIKDLIVYAELTINLLENPTNKEFQEQINGKVDLSEFLQYEESSNFLKDFDNDIKTNIFTTIKNNIINGLETDNLSDVTKNFINTISSRIVADIENGNITEIYDTVSQYQDVVENSKVLSSSEIEKLTKQINLIPNLMLDTVLRSG